jgi:hypothetical protein
VSASEEEYDHFRTISEGSRELAGHERRSREKGCKCILFAPRWSDHPVTCSVLIESVQTTQSERFPVAHGAHDGYFGSVLPLNRCLRMKKRTPCAASDVIEKEEEKVLALYRKCHGAYVRKYLMATRCTKRKWVDKRGEMLGIVSQHSFSFPSSPEKQRREKGASVNSVSSYAVMARALSC